jgi:hypothetical protein
MDFFLVFLLLSINVGLLCIPAGLMCDDVLRALKEIVPDHKLDYFADWGIWPKKLSLCNE